jgi:hypothetical protein
MSHMRGLNSASPRAYRSVRYSHPNHKVAIPSIMVYGAFCSASGIESDTRTLSFCKLFVPLGENPCS